MKKADNFVYWGPLPSIEEALNLFKKNFKFFLNLYGYAEYVEVLEKKGAEILVHPIPDLSFIPVEEAHTLVQKIIQKSKGGVKTYVHCFAGIGRSSTLIALYLVSKSLKPSEASEKIIELQPMWPESPIQRIVVNWYFRLLRKIGVEKALKLVELGAEYGFHGGLAHASTVAHVATDLLENTLPDIREKDYRIAYAAGILHETSKTIDRIFLEKIYSILPNEAEDVKTVLENYRFMEENAEKLILESNLDPLKLKLILVTLKLADTIGNAYPGFSYNGISKIDNELIISVSLGYINKMSKVKDSLEKITGLKVKVEEAAFI